VWLIKFEYAKLQELTRRQRKSSHRDDSFERCSRCFGRQTPQNFCSQFVKRMCQGRCHHQWVCRICFPGGKHPRFWSNLRASEGCLGQHKTRCSVRIFVSHSLDQRNSLVRWSCSCLSDRNGTTLAGSVLVHLR